MLKFQTVAEKPAKNFRGLLFLPHPVYKRLLFSFYDNVTGIGLTAGKRSLKQSRNTVYF